MLTRRFRAVLLAATWLVAGCGGAAPADPAASPRIDCTGLPATKCDEAVASVARSLPNEHPSLIEIRCLSDPCTASSGTMETTVTLADGRQLHANPSTWFDGNATGGGVAPPVAPDDPKLPVQPTCQGIPLASCRQVAGGSFESGHGAIVSILVRCTKNPCTSASGEGDTIVTYADGTQSTSGWGYANSGG